MINHDFGENVNFTKEKILKSYIQENTHTRKPNLNNKVHIESSESKDS